MPRRLLAYLCVRLLRPCLALDTLCLQVRKAPPLPLTILNCWWIPFGRLVAPNVLEKRRDDVRPSRWPLM